VIGLSFKRSDARNHKSPPRIHQALLFHVSMFSSSSNAKKRYGRGPKKNDSGYIDKKFTSSWVH
jgi:hypothetical protein